MARKSDKTPIPSREWQVPTDTWAEIVSRYVTFIQVPGWRASVRSDGGDKRSCLTPTEACALGNEMLHTLARVLSRRFRSGTIGKAKIDDLVSIADRLGRHIPRHQRCSKRIFFHLQRAYLFNSAGYTCLYCGRTAWGVYAEETESEPRRTLRFEIDHRTTRRMLAEPNRFDPSHLVVACRSCNTIKAEMPKRRFRLELASLAAALQRARQTDKKTV